MTETKQIEEEERERVSKILSERLEAHDESRRAAQVKLHDFCEGLRARINEFEERVNRELEEKYTVEDNRLQTALNELSPDDDDGDVSKAIQKAKAELLVMQSYEVVVGGLDEDNQKSKFSIKSMCELKTERKLLSLKVIDFEERKARSLIPSFTKKGELSLSFAFFDEDEAEVLKEFDLHFEVEVIVWEKGHEEDTSKTFTKELTLGSGDEPICFRNTFTASTTYCLKMRIAHQEMSTQWSDEVGFTTPEFKCCVWKECPDYVHKKNKYSVDEENPGIATKIYGGYGYCTIIGNTPLPLNQVTSWSIKILKSKDNGYDILIGVAPSDIDQNKEYNYMECGWYFRCSDSVLWSGPPHNYGWPGKEYGPRKGKGKYVHTGDSFGVVMDTAKGELSFVLNGVNLGVAYEGILLDKPLVPCVILGKQGDSVELDTSEVKENVVNSSISIPSNITTTSITWDSITLTWDVVKGASFYQIEVGGRKFWNISTTNAFTKRGLLPDTEHTFRVRAVRGDSVSEWSDVVKGRTQKESFETSGWEECPDYVYDKKYFVGKKNPRIATKIGKDYCTIIGNTALPLNQVTSWSIKVLKSKGNGGDGIIIGVAPFDINRWKDNNNEKCGWYFHCHGSTLVSGPPHKYRGKEYGPRKENGKYIHTGGSVGVVMDTAKGELSFILNSVNLGVAYEGISLDKPLVPCVLLGWKGDSVELVF